MSLRSKIENHVGIFLAGSLLTGFIAGTAAYEKAINTFGYKIIHEDKLLMIEAGKQDLKEENRELRKIAHEARVELSRMGKLSREEVFTPIMETTRQRLDEEREREKAIELKAKIDAFHAAAWYIIISIVLIVVLVLILSTIFG